MDDLKVLCIVARHYKMPLSNVKCFRPILSMHNSCISNVFFYRYSLHVILPVGRLLADLNNSLDTTNRLLAV